MRTIELHGVICTMGYSYKVFTKSYQSSAQTIDSMNKHGMFPIDVIYNTQHIAHPENILLPTEIRPQLGN